MLEVLLQRSTVVSLAVIGGILSLCVTVLTSRGALSENAIKNLNKVAYGFMGLSMLLFIAAGLTH
jgi:hypothetical protein